MDESKNISDVVINVCFAISLNNNDELNYFKQTLESLLVQDVKMSLVITDSSTISFDSELTSIIKNFYRYYYVHNKTDTYGEKIQNFLNICDCEYILYLDQNIKIKNNSFLKLIYEQLHQSNRKITVANNFTFAKVSALRAIGGFCKKYQSSLIKIFGKDVKTRLNVGEYLSIANSSDSIVEILYEIDDKYSETDLAFFYKRLNEFNNKYTNSSIIYIDGAMGDNVMAIPLVRSYKDGVFICAKFPELFSNFENVKGFIDWHDEYYGGLGFSPYEHGNSLNIDSIEKTYCSMYNREYDNNNFYFNEYNLQTLDELEKQISNNEIKNKIICIAPMASMNENNTPANKNWLSIRWFEIVQHLKSVGFHIIQLGKNGDEIIPNTSQVFFDRSFQEVCGVIKNAELVLCVDSFIHHLSSAIGTKTICLTPDNNEHAYHHNNHTYYVSKQLQSVNANNRWMIDAQQPERIFSMKLIETGDVLKVVYDVLKDRMYNPL